MFYLLLLIHYIVYVYNVNVHKMMMSDGFRVH